MHFTYFDLFFFLPVLTTTLQTYLPKNFYVYKFEPFSMFDKTISNGRRIFSRSINAYNLCIHSTIPFQLSQSSMYQLKKNPICFCMEKGYLFTILQKICKLIYCCCNKKGIGAKTENHLPFFSFFCSGCDETHFDPLFLRH